MPERTPEELERLEVVDQACSAVEALGTSYALTRVDFVGAEARTYVRFEEETATRRAFEDCQHGSSTNCSDARSPQWKGLGCEVGTHESRKSLVCDEDGRRCSSPGAPRLLTVARPLTELLDDRERVILNDPFGHVLGMTLDTASSDGLSFECRVPGYREGDPRTFVHVENMLAITPTGEPLNCVD